MAPLTLRSLSNTELPKPPDLVQTLRDIVDAVNRTDAQLSSLGRRVTVINATVQPASTPPPSLGPFPVVVVATDGAILGNGTVANPLRASVDGSTVQIVNNQLTAVGGAIAVVVDPAGALDGDGTAGSPLAVRVDATDIQIDGSNNLALIPTGVTPGVYGSATQVPAFIVDANGRLTSAADVAIIGLISGLTAPRFPFATSATALSDNAAVAWDSTFLSLKLASNGQTLDPPLNAAELPQIQSGGDFDGVAAGHANWYLDSYANVSSINFRRAQGTQASKTAIGVNDMLNLRCIGYDGTAYGIGGFFRFRGTSTWTTINHGTDFLVFLAATGTAPATPTETLRLQGDYSLSLGPSFATSSFRYSGTNYTLTIATGGQVLDAPTTATDKPQIHIGGDFAGVTAGIGAMLIDGYGAQGNITMRRAGGTQAAKTALASADIVFNFRSYAYSGATNGYQLGGLLRMVANGAQTNTNAGQDFLVLLTANGAITNPAEMMRVRGSTSGTVGINTAAPTAPLDVRGVPVDIGYLAHFRPLGSNNGFIQVTSTLAASGACGFAFTNIGVAADEWRLFMLGNSSNSLRYQLNSTGLMWLNTALNVTISANLKNPTTGTYCLLFENGTAPTAMPTDVSGLYTKDVSASSQLHAMNEADEETQLTGDMTIPAARDFLWSGRTRLRVGTNGNLTLLNNAAGDFGLLHFGGTSASFPALKRSTVVLQTKLADDSAFAQHSALEFMNNRANFLMRTAVAWNNGAGGGAGTITNAPTAGNPTKWIPVDDNGTTRHIPAW